MQRPAAPSTTRIRAPAYWVIPNTEIALARMTDGPNAGQYRIAAEMLERLPEFHSRIIDQPPLRPTPYPHLRSMQVQSTGPLVPEIVVDVIPAPLKWTVFSTPLWKAALAVLALVLVIRLNLLWTRLAQGVKAWLPGVGDSLVQLTKPAFLASSFATLHLS